MSYTNYNHDFRRNRITEPAQLVAAANLWTPTSDQKCMLGAIYGTNQGDEYRYMKNGATEIAKALLVQAEALDAQQLAKIQTAYGASAGVTKLSAVFTTGSGIANDELVDGYLLVNDGGTAMGDLYTIKKNTWTTSDTIMVIEIADEGGLRNAVLVTDDLTIIKNQFRDVIVVPTTLTAPIVGATTTIVPASYYFWAKTKGVAALLVDNGDTIVVGEPVGHIDGCAGAGTIGLTATQATDTVLGICLYASTNDEAALINLQIPGL